MDTNYNEIGIKAFREKRYEEAAQAFTQAIEGQPNDAIGYVNFGTLLAAMGDIERAERFFQKAITVDEKAATAYYGLANLYYEAERYTEAAKLYQKSIDYGIEGADAYYMLAKSFEREQRIQIGAAIYATCSRACAKRSANTFIIRHLALLFGNVRFCEAGAGICY